MSDTDYDSDISSDTCSDNIILHSKMLKIIDFHEESQMMLLNKESHFFQRMKIYFLKEKLHIDLKIYFYFL
jgi:hypothetical protein